METLLEKTILKEPLEQDSPKPRLIDQVGKTPLLELTIISSDVQPIRILAKAEWFNPGGSVKDRAALNMIRVGEKSGALTRDKILLDASSGNTAIAFAMFAAALGYRVKLTVPENTSPLTKRILRTYGAELVLTDSGEGSDGAIREARRLYFETPELYYYPDQYNNPANWLAHYNGTGAEIIQQTQGQVTHFVAGLGTTGTFVGVARRLREFNRDIKLISVQPDSPFHGLEGMKHMESALVPGIYDPELADLNIEVGTEEAQQMVKRLAKQEGLLVGMSSGAALSAALKIGRMLDDGVIVVVFPDSASKYFEQKFWSEDDYGA
ncbi:cysteine synthase family protein [candidate division KSB1 bacterium]|nr:cysteine synthase family protein [candidate division KSB1 bacterium]NIR70540.1 cysteine synthase family protein [candidate division KSB1 bacterium]NIS26212.1 cysteine synthase family protein [candidate division KSB1 bacterium]NIT72991.1 cysteine synthase family protein [candidate division KSB1 bacterium]NIU26860.1 cysteine synthase family protein [candidate division KSB1 bacterium]